MEDYLKKELSEIINDLNLDEKELEHVDSYIKKIIKNYKPLIDAHNSVLKNKELLELFKNNIIGKNKGEDSV